MKRYYLIYSEKGIILSYKPLITTEAVIADREYVHIAGSLSELEKISKELEPKYIYLKELVIPGFIDSHLHIDSLGFELESIDLTSTVSREELLSTIRNLKPNIGEWVVCGRFDYLQYPDRKPPTRCDLDKVVSQHPVLLIHRSGHMGVLNTRGLEIVKEIGISNYIDYDNGWIYESSLWLLRELILRNTSFENKSRVLLKACDYLRKHGVTSIGVAGCSEDCLNTLISIEKDLRVRIYVYLNINSFDLAEAVKKIVLINSKLSRVRVNGFKIIIDGALGPRTAYLTNDYSDQPGNRGLMLCDKDWLEKVVERINNYGLQVAIHTIGDAALDTVLSIYRKLRSETFIYRNRIEHASLVREDQLCVIRELKPIIVVQPHFIITDKWVLDRIGYSRLKWLYKYRSLYESTIVALSTDAPVEPVNPWRTVYAAVTRGENIGLTHGVLTSDEKLSIVDALDAYTRGSAYALRDDRLGCLYPGCYSDMVIVDKNPLEITNPEELLSIESKPVDLE